MIAAERPESSLLSRRSLPPPQNMKRRPKSEISAMVPTIVTASVMTRMS